MIKSAFIDNGKHIDDELNILGINSFKNHLIKLDQDNETVDNKVSEWQVNQLCICYNLPALAMFISQKQFFSVLYPHL